MPDGPLAESDFADQVLQKEPTTPLAPFLYLFIAQRQRAAAEAAELNQNTAVAQAATREGPRVPPEGPRRAGSDLRPRGGRSRARAVRLRAEDGRRKMTKRLLCACLALGLAAPASGQVADWTAIEKEAVATLQRYIRINTANPPGDVRKAADLLEAILEAEHIPTTGTKPARAGRSSWRGSRGPAPARPSQSC